MEAEDAGTTVTLQGLDAEQLAVATAPVFASMLVLAGAGSGKTRTLLARMAFLSRHGCKVRAFSHANSTVGELLRRLSVLPASLKVAVSTMHSYAASQLFWHGDPVPVADHEASLSRYADLLERGELVCAETHVLVDEAQDLSDVQSRIVRALQAAGVHVCLVGDGEQSIYGFQHASPEHLLRFGRELPEGSRFTLRNNYRARHHRLVDIANSIAAVDIRVGRAVEMRAAATGVTAGAAARLCGYRGARDLAVLGEVRRIQLLGERATISAASPGSGCCRASRPATICILAHTNHVLEDAFVALMEHGVPAAVHTTRRAGEFRRLDPALLEAGVVQLLTIHGAKGSEYDHVLLVTGEDRGDRKEGEDGGGSESRRELYVACTRAKRTLTILVAQERQPCRWLTPAWCDLDVGRLEPFAPGEAEPERLRAGPWLSVTELLAGGGHLGLIDHYGLVGRAEQERLHAACAVHLAESDAEPEELPAQVPKAYGFGLELYVGRLFEFRAMLAFDTAGVRALAREVVETLTRTTVNISAWEFGVGPAGAAWWREHGATALVQFVESVRAHQGGQAVSTSQLLAAVLAQCPPEVRRALGDALSPRGVLFGKFRGYPAALEAMLARLHAAGQAGLTDPAGLPPFSAFFRKYEKTWDNQRLMSMRPTFDAAFLAAQRVAWGEGVDALDDDLALFAALEAFWQVAEERRSPEGKQALLHLAQPSGSPARLLLEDLRLNEAAGRLLEADARRVMQLLGPPTGSQVACRVDFRCRGLVGGVAEDGEAAEGRGPAGCDDADDLSFAAASLSVEAVVYGRADVGFADGCLEIKAVKVRVEAVHAAQALWYPAALRLPRAYLWDVYRRRLLVWSTPEEGGRRAFLGGCIWRYLQVNAPPGLQERIWPQRVALLE